MPSTSKSIFLPTNVFSGLIQDMCVLSHSGLLLNSVSKQPLPFQVSAHPPRNGTMDSSFCFLVLGGSAGNRQRQWEKSPHPSGKPISLPVSALCDLA